MRIFKTMLAPTDGASPDSPAAAPPDSGASESDRGLGFLTQTMATIWDDITRSVHELQGVAGELARLSRTPGPLDKQQLATPLHSLYGEIQRQQSCLEIVSSLSEKLSRVPARGQIPVAGDPITMLPGRRDAERVFSLLRSRKQSAFMGLFYLQRLALVNSRFGTAVGDTLVSRFSRHLSKMVFDDDHLFRWVGAGFLGIFQRQTPLPVFSLQIDRHVAIRIVETIYVKDRTALIPISCVWHVMAFSPEEAMEDTVSAIDSVFADWQAGRAVNLRRSPMSSTI